MQETKELDMRGTCRRNSPDGIEILRLKSAPDSRNVASRP